MASASNASCWLCSISPANVSSAAFPLSVSRPCAWSSCSPAAGSGASARPTSPAWELCASAASVARSLDSAAGPRRDSRAASRRSMRCSMTRSLSTSSGLGGRPFLFSATLAAVVVTFTVVVVTVAGAAVVVVTAVVGAAVVAGAAVVVGAAAFFFFLCKERPSSSASCRSISRISVSVGNSSAATSGSAKASTLCLERPVFGFIVIFAMCRSTSGSSNRAECPSSKSVPAAAALSASALSPASTLPSFRRSAEKSSVKSSLSSATSASSGLEEASVVSSALSSS
mmetsp:Transcript_14722/g.35694  ORF Transcript_14722/g.35694 Transcript_14722/m.35694 type:complete len:285 (-) Transcript_14722:885-1739(-)